MNSGCRDAVALAWRLQLILTGSSNVKLLDSYTSERLGHVQQVTGLAVMLGKAICVTSEEEAAILHAQIRTGPPPPSTFRLGLPGLFDDSQPQSGFLGMQRHVINSDGKSEWFDLVHARGWILLSTVSNAFDFLSSATKATFIDKMGGKSVFLDATQDFEGKYTKWLKELDSEVVLVRPDYYVAFSASLEKLEVNLTSFLPGLCLE